jgi:malonyl-CoA O-methyltransferase
LRTPRWRQRLVEALQALSDVDGRPALSFELVYGHAFKAAPRPRVAERTEVGLDEMRQMVRSRRTT